MQKFAIFALAGAFLGQEAFANHIESMLTLEDFELATIQAESLVETEAMDTLRCGEQFKRFATEQPNFAELLQAEGKWTDPEFDEQQAMQGQGNYIWKRMSDEFPESKGYSLWGANGINFDEINQGSLGNCWTLSAMQTIAEYPERLQELFANPYINDKGVYAVNMYALGIPITVVIDDYIPFHKSYPDYPKFGRPDEGKGLWPVILEKAIAKYFGFYNAIVAGQPAQAVQAFTGAPNQYASIGRLSEDQLWSMVLNSNDSRDMISIATKGQQYSNGLVQGHAYAVLGAYELSDGTRLIKTANPWGRDQYKGDWSDGSSLWTEKFKEEVSHEEESDGVFFQTVAQLKSDWAGIWINKDIQDYQHSYWLNLGRDISTPGARAWWCKDGPCRANTWTVTSQTAQKVHIGILRQANRAYKNCSNMPKSLRQYVFAEGQSAYNHLGEGKWYEYSMTAGQTVKINAEWDIMSGDQVNEYSVVAWAQTEAVEIVHGAGEESDSYPHQASLHSDVKSAEDDTASQEAADRAEQEAARQLEEQAAQKAAEDKAAAEEEAARQAKEEAERQRKIALEKEQKAKDEAEAARVAEDARKAKEAEDKAAAEEEAAHKRREEAARKQKEAEEAAREAQEEAEKQKQAQKDEQDKADSVFADFDQFVADIHIGKEFANCRNIQSTGLNIKADGSFVRQFGHSCEGRDVILQANLSAECYDEKLVKFTSQHQDSAECVHNGTKSVTCMFEIRSGEENALGMLFEDSNCPVSIRRWFVEKLPAYESSESSEPSLLDKKLTHMSVDRSCTRPTNSKRGNMILVGTDCPTKYVKGSLIMKPETWMSADIVSDFDNFDSCESYRNGKYWQCFFKIMPGVENALFLEIPRGISSYAYRQFEMFDLE